MSENEELQQTRDARVSIFAELSSASIGVLIALGCVVIASIVFYVFMNLSPKKTVKVTDDAGLFTESEFDAIEDMAKELSKEKDISVVIVTTRDKGAGYSNDDYDEKRFAEDYYMDNVKTVPLQNNSGVCILIDVTLDEPGQRFFWLYTYGTAHFAVSDDECNGLFRSYITELGAEEYGTAILGITDDLKAYSYKGYTAIVVFTIFIPIAAALLVTYLLTPRRKLDNVPGIYQYHREGKTKVVKDDFINSKRIYHESSSSGGGFSGGGGGGFSGGGGGGFSGGGGGRF